MPAPGRCSPRCSPPPPLSPRASTGSSRPVPTDRAQELRSLPRHFEQRGLELQRRQQAPHPRRDDGPRGPSGTGHGDAHVDHDRGQRVRLATASPPARVLRRQPHPERRRPDRRLLRGRPGLRSQGQVADDRQQLRRARAQQLLADAVQEVLPHHRDQRRPTPRGEPLLPRRLVEAPVAAREHAVLPRALPAVAAGARRRVELRVSQRKGQGPLRRHGAFGRPGGGGLVRRGRRVLLGGRREEAVDRGNGQRGLFQRRLGPPRQRQSVLRA